MSTTTDVVVSFENDGAFNPARKGAIRASILDGSLTPLVSEVFPISGVVHKLVAPQVPAGTTLHIQFESATASPDIPGLDNVAVTPSAEADAQKAATAVLEGAFGRAEVNTTRPGLTSLTLRCADGQLDSQSILATASRKAAWAVGAYTYADVEEGRRMESRNAKPESVEVKPGHITFRGIKLNFVGGFAPLASEDWEMRVEGDDLVWKVTRTWLTTTRVQRSGMPALFMGFHGPYFKNSTIGTWWYQPEYISGKFDALYDLPDQNGGAFHPRSNKSFIRDEEPWAVLKLFTNWQNQADPRLAAKGAYLYRGGGFCWLNEFGATIGDANWQPRKAGQVETAELRIGAVDKTETGYRMKVSLPDKALEKTITGFYSSLINGGSVAEHETYAFGNESDGYMTGSIIIPMMSAAMSAGVPAEGQISKHPFSFAQAVRQELDSIYSTVSPEGLDRYAYNHTGKFVMMNLETIDAVKNYLLHTGDLAFVKTNIDRMERQMDYFKKRLNADGLYVQPKIESQPNWYYDVLQHNGVSGFINSQLYRALGSLAEMEHALGDEVKAAEYRDIAVRLRDGFNKVLWREDLAGGPRYVDWITVEGKEITYFCDLCQFPPVAYGIASPEQAKKVLATADKRLEELAKLGYEGYGTPSAFWPIPDELCVYDWQKNTANPFGFYFNGGHLLNSVYYELMARANAGDSKGLYYRLSKFAELIRKNGAVGSNWVNWKGEPGFAGIYDKTEPYLADMIHVTAAVTEGLLGLHPTWDKLEVKPCLPDGWMAASATILYKGKPVQVSIQGDKVTVKDGN